MNKGYAYVAIAVIAFSTMELSGKMIANVINPYQLNFIRFLIGGLVLLPFALKDLKQKNIRLGLKDFIYFTWAGFLGILISMSLFQLAIVYTKASTVAVIFSTNPVFTIPLAYLFLKEKLTWQTLLCLVVSLIGVGFILNPFNMSSDIKGLIFAILSSLTFSLYSIVVKTRVERYGTLALNCLSFLFGDLMLLFYIAYAHLPILKGINYGNIYTLIYLGVVVTGIGYLCYFLAMEVTSTATASMVFFIKPALAPLLSFIILKESIPLNTLAGIAFIIIGAIIKFTSSTGSTITVSNEEEAI